MKIEIKESTMVRPAAETPSGSLWLSNLDLLSPANYHTLSVHFYSHDGSANFFDATALKEALSRALVDFYPYAGRLKLNKENRLEIECNGEGILLVEAECSGALDELGDFTPRPELNLIPKVDYSKGMSTYPLMLFQITRFKCGGVALGVANEHHLSDGVAALHFINTWAHYSRGVPAPSPPPHFDRTALSARNPPQPQFSHAEYQPPPTLENPLPATDIAHSKFKLTRAQLNSLKAKCAAGDSDGHTNGTANGKSDANGTADGKSDANGTANGKSAAKRYSTFEVLAGHIWRSVCTARGLPAEQETKLHIPFDGRSRLNLPPGYFGNAIFFATPIATCGEIESNSLSYAVRRVGDGIARLDEEYLKSSLDFLELQPDISKLAQGAHSFRCPNLWVISWVWLPIYEPDFGWGKAVHMGPWAAPFEGKSYLLPNPENDGSLFVSITLHKQHMERFQKLFYEI
uniref:Rosmarinate synthase n=1 Tax=Lavandula angustifolia TaxID=39329 RepID=Q0GA14_LAVAN|nr:putative alcohol acyltransferase 1 [Lavandula angustifolia]